MRARPCCPGKTCENGLPDAGVGALTRSHLRDLLGRADDWTDGRTHRTPHDDEALLAELHQEIVDLPSYGYRRACALVTRMDRRDAQTVLAQLPAAFEHFNEAHPHSSLKMRSPREFRRQQANQVRPDPSMDPALYCD